MKKFSRGGRILLAAILMLFSSGLTACGTATTVVLPEAKVQKMLRGESASFDGYLLTPGALSKLLESAEKCQTK